MSHETIEERVAKIESLQQFHNMVIESVAKDHKEIKQSLNEIKTTLAVLSEKQSNNQSIPSLEPRVRELERKADNVFGGWKIVALFISVGALFLKNIISWALAFNK